MRPDGDAAGRPVTFAFNGGPGASSAYLHLGAMGPWRLPLDNITPSSTPTVVPNPETWLDFTDLVFVDPVGTGYSRFINTSDEVRKQFWSVDGDIDVLATFMRKWIEKNGRQASKKFIAGESYGGIRAPRLASKLNEQGVAVSGLVLVSAPLDLGWRGGRHSPLGWVARLPSMAAAVREEKSPFDREALREVERYAAGDYLQDLLRGERDSAAVERITARIAPLTGLDPALVRRRAGRIDMRTFQRERRHGVDREHVRCDGTRHRSRSLRLLLEFRRSGSQRLARTALERDDQPLCADTQLARGGAVPATQRAGELALGLGRRTQHPGDRRANLRSVLAADPKLRVLVTHGASDLVTPYFETQMILDQMPAFASPDRLKSTVYGGGHMYYSRDASRRALRDDARELYRAAEQAPRG